MERVLMETAGDNGLQITSEETDLQHTNRITPKADSGKLLQSSIEIVENFETGENNVLELNVPFDFIEDGVLISLGLDKLEQLGMCLRDGKEFDRDILLDSIDELLSSGERMIRLARLIKDHV